VKSLPTLIAICLAVCGGDAIGDCPAGYPEGFPRIDGGTFISVPSQAGQPVIPNAFYVLRYDQTASALFGSVLNEASNAAWIVETQSEAQEPGGPRYRALLRKAEQAISISVVSKPEGSYLLVVKRLSKQWRLRSRQMTLEPADRLDLERHFSLWLLSETAFDP